MRKTMRRRMPSTPHWISAWMRDAKKEGECDLSSLIYTCLFLCSVSWLILLMYLQGAARERGDREIPYGAAQNPATVLRPEGLCVTWWALSCWIMIWLSKCFSSYFVLQIIFEILVWTVRISCYYIIIIKINIWGLEFFYSRIHYCSKCWGQ